MDRQILNITANEQILTVDEPIRISTNKVNYIEARFDLGENWSGYDSVRAVWFNDFNCISTVLDSLGNCAVPFEVMKRKGNVKVNLVGSISEDDVLTDRLTSYPVVAVIVDCTAQITGANTSPITPSEFEQFAQRVHTDADRAETAATNAETSAQNASDSATSAHNSAQSAHNDKIAIEEAIAEVIQQIEDFEQVQVVVNTLPPSSQATSDFTDGVLTLGIPQGVKGDTGNGIQSIRKTSTSGLVDTYTITFTDGQTTTFNVTNGAKGDTGNGIQSIAKTSTVGLVDTYTITYTDGITTTFTVTNGEKGDTGEVSQAEFDEAITDLKSDLSGVVSNLFAKGIVEYNVRAIPKAVKYTGYNSDVSTGMLQLRTLSGYDSFCFYANDDLSIYFESGLTDYTAISVLTNPNGTWTTQSYGYSQSGDSSARYRTSDSNLPSKASPLSLASGTLIAITVLTAKNPKVYISNQYTKDLKDSVVQQVLDVPPSHDMMANTLYDTSTNVQVPSLENIVKYDNYSTDANTYGIGLYSLTGYTSYMYIVTEDCDIYVSDTVPSGAYYALCHAKNYSGKQTYTVETYKGTNPVRYRASDNNLPSENSKLHVSAGDVLGFTFLAGSSFAINGLTTVYTQKVLTSENAYVKKPNKIVPYTESATSKGYKVYTEQGDSYIQYNFMHQTINISNCDCWRIDAVKAVDADYDNAIDLTESGEIECAVLLNGRSDYSGGRMHGDEVTTSIRIELDGKVVAPSDLVDIVEFETLTVFTVSNLYDPADSVTVIAEHGKRYVFDRNGLELTQYLDWKVSDTIRELYLAMLTASKSVTDSGYTSKSFTPIVLASNYGYYDDINYVAEYSDTLPILMSMEAEQYPCPAGHNLPQLRLTDNNSTYNKAYFVGYSGAVTSGTRMDSKVTFKFEYNSDLA